MCRYIKNQPFSRFGSFVRSFFIFRQLVQEVNQVKHPVVENGVAAVGVLDVEDLLVVLDQRDFDDVFHVGKRQKVGHQCDADAGFDQLANGLHVRKIQQNISFALVFFVKILKGLGMDKAFVQQNKRKFQGLRKRNPFFLAKGLSLEAKM